MWEQVEWNKITDKPRMRLDNSITTLLSLLKKYRVKYTFSYANFLSSNKHTQNIKIRI